MENLNKTNRVLDVVIVGAGHAGLSISYLLKSQGLNHIVFERNTIGESWKSKRWDSFKLNTANHKTTLPGMTYAGDKPEEFYTAKEFVEVLENYQAKFQLPVEENSRVISLEKNEVGNFFITKVLKKGKEEIYQSKQVVVCSGNQNERKIPEITKNISADVVQIHASEYKNPSQLPKGAIIVVGSAQSGCQIAEDLAEAGRKVFLATSSVGRTPRRYRGKDIVDWLSMMNFYRSKTDEADQKTISMPIPLLSGVGQYGHTLSYQLLAKKGITLVGKLENGDDKSVFFTDDSTANVKFGDAVSTQIKLMLNKFIQDNNLAAPEPETDNADEPDLNGSCASSITSLNFKEQNISSIIWTTGFTGNFSYLQLPVFDDKGNPKHKNGISEIKGLFFLGLSWLRTRGSGMVFGSNDDAEFIADELLKNVKAMS